ncbi:MAG: alkaline phosphatase PhoX [Actinomycetota bacterium]
MAHIDRREFLRRGAAWTGGLSISGSLLALAACTDGGGGVGDHGERAPVDMGDLELPAGFSYRIVSRQGDEMSDGNPTPGMFDGMDAFPGPGGTTVLVRNHENRGHPEEIGVVVPDDNRYDPDPERKGGNTKVVIDRDRRLVESFAVLGGTSTNCAGGRTPWGSWITCEETFDAGDPAHGYAFEIDSRASGPVDPAPVRAAGRMVHEAVAWHNDVLYATEDQGDAAFYRVLFDAMPQRPGDLARATGRLEALKIVGDDNFTADTNQEWPVGEGFGVEWVTIGDPEPDDDDVRHQAHELGAAIFNREEGACVGGGKVYFNCTDAGGAGLGQVWELDPARETITLIYESPGPEQLNHPDNLVVGRTGDLFICEDNDSAVHMRRLTPEGQIFDFARANDNSEFCGACFDASGRTLFVNQQGDREQGIPGVTYAIWGPWRSL